MSVELKYVDDEDVVNGVYIVPEGVEVILNNALAGLEELKKVVLPNSLKEIKHGAFRDCEQLETVVFNDGLKSIEDLAFYGCDSLKSVNIPDSVTHIGKGAFSTCFELEEVKLPKNLETMESELFSNCHDLKNIVLPQNLKKIKEKVFLECLQLRKIDIPNSVTEIQENVFEGCVSLKEVTLPENLKSISPYLFDGCTSLSKIKLPKKLELIDHKAFFNCKDLTSIDFPKTLKRIDSFAFCCCDGLEEIYFPDTLKEISDRAFQDCGYLHTVHLPDKIELLEEFVFKGCSNLQNINIPSSIKKLPNGIFSYCSLREVVIPNNIVEIGDRVFENCFDLIDIKLPKNLVRIGQGAFYNCNGISNLDLPSSLREIDLQAFGGCTGIKNLVIPNGVVNIGKSAFKECEFEELIVPSSVKNFPFVEDDQFSYFTKLKNGFMLSQNPTPTSLDADLLGINYAFLSSNWKYHEKIFNEVRNPVIKDFYNTLVYSIKDNYELLENFLDVHTFTFYKRFIKMIDENKKASEKDSSNSTYVHADSSFYNNQKKDLGKMLFNLGAFGVETTLENGKKFNYAHQISGFLELKLERGEVNLKDLLNAFDKTEIKGFNKEFNEFFINNFNELMEEEKINDGFIAKCYNDFDKVQATHTSNKGHQRKLKATIDKFRKYFFESKFSGVNEENIEIARTIAPWFDRQTAFDEALQIYKDMKTKNTPTNIVGSHLKEDVFEKIDNYSSKINKTNSNTLDNLFSVADEQFSFEWLEKNDPRNLILGKLCTCCSHLEGAGFSIMRASMIDPNVQTLAIKDSSGTIVAKSTIYVNQKEGYAVFNNVEVNDNLIGLYENMTLIYRKFISGTNLFINKYNEQHKDNPLKIVTVGVNNNDLINLLRKYHSDSPEIFRSIDYSEYGLPDRKHRGDSDEEQIIVWKSDDLKLKEPDKEILLSEIYK